MSRPARSNRRRIVKVAVWWLYLTALVALVEYGLHAFDLVPRYTPQPDLAIKLYYEDANGLVQLRPNARYFTNGSIPVVVNADGYRDRLYPRIRDRSSVRIAVIGDSFTMGDGVRVEDSYPKQLERLFAAEERPVEVINFGITATNTLNQLALLRHAVLDFSPDLVVLGFNLNDYKTDRGTDFDRARAQGYDYRVNEDRTVIILPPQRTGFERVKNVLVNRVGLVHLAEEAVKAVRRPDSPPSIAPALDVTTSLVQRQEIPAASYARTNQALLDMRALLASAGVKFAVLIIPAMTELPRPYVDTFDQYPYAELHRRIGQFIAEHGITHLDLLPELRGRRLRPLIVSNFDPLFNADGNAVIASALHRFLVAGPMAD